MFGSLLYDILFLGLPLVLLVLLGVSIYRYASAKSANKKAPGTFSDAEIQKRKTLLIVFAVMAGILLAVVIGFILLLFMAVAFM